MPSPDLPDEMTAIGFDEHGPIDNLGVLTVERPDPGPGEVLVDVHATALNHLDVFAVRELDNYVSTYPFWSGSDVAGEVVAVGAGVDPARWSPGDRVLIDPVLTCGDCEFCVRGDRPRCVEYRTFGEHIPGGLAEYVTIPAENLLAIPDHVETVTAASVPIAGMTAWGALAERGDIEPYEDLLIVGATGGVGTFAVQIATRIFNVGAVYATTSSAAKAEFLRGLGVDHVIDYTEDRFDERIWALTEGRGVDVAYNNVGGETWTKSLRSLRNGGRLLTSGATAGPNPPTEIRLIFVRGLDIRGSSVATLAGFREFLAYVWDGTIEPVIDQTLPFEEYRTGFERMVDRDLVGKVVLTQG